MKTIKAIYYTGQCVFSAIVIIVGLLQLIRAAAAGQIFVSVMFVAWIANGYFLLWRASYADYRTYRASLK